MAFPTVIPGGITSRSVRLRLNSYPSLAQLQLHPIMGGHSSTIELSVKSAFDNCWIVDATGLAPNTVYFVDVTGEREAAIFRTPPAELVGSEELLIVLTSCYFRSDADWLKAKNVRICLRRRAMEKAWSNGEGDIVKNSIPHATILCGDQIYGDVPAGGLQDVDKIYHDEYFHTWKKDRLGPLLRLGANFFTCDDHEYWNDYPSWQFYLSRTYDSSWKETAKVAMKKLWEQQAMWNFAPGFEGGELHKRGWGHGDLGTDVSIFVTDTRTDRTDLDGERRPDVLNDTRDSEAHITKDKGFMSSAQEKALFQWLDNLKRGKIGFLILGQPLLLEGDYFDSALPDYGKQYTDLMDKIIKVVENGVIVVILSGDIHWGRLTSWSPTGKIKDGGLIEFVASPVGYVGVGNFLGSWMPSITSRPVPETPDPQKWRGKWPLPGNITSHFSTNENNFGLISVRKDNEENFKLRFELWNLETKQIALSQWDISGDLFDGKCICEFPPT